MSSVSPGNVHVDANDGRIRRRFERFVDRSPHPKGCWIWRGCKKARNYGSFKVATKSWLAHRASYELHVGPIPAGRNLNHRCDNPSCVNPKHLRLGSQFENMREAHERGLLHPSRGQWRTHCPNSHPYDASTPIRQGARVCRTCERQRSIRYRISKGLRVGPKTQCKRGHPFSPENTNTDSRGRRKCLLCDMVYSLRRTRPNATEAELQVLAMKRIDECPPEVAD